MIIAKYQQNIIILYKKIEYLYSLNILLIYKLLYTIQEA